MDEANDALLRLAMLDLGECGGKPAAKKRRSRKRQYKW
jgi:hypothetical protein